MRILAGLTLLVVTCIYDVKGRELEPASEKNGTKSLNTGCPSFDQVPVSESNGGLWPVFVAGRRYHDRGHDVPELACNGNFYDEIDGYQLSSSDDQCYAMGSLIVNAGCKLTFFSDYNFEGEHKTFDGPILLPNPTPEFGDSCCGGVFCVDSFLWSCKQHFPDCVPSDSWNIVTQLDNSQSNWETDFTFEQTKGTSWSHESSESMSVGTSVEASYKESFFGVFEASMGVSMSTGYNWGSVDSTTKSDAKSYTIHMAVPAHEKVQIEAAVGNCGSSNVYTQLFRVISTKTGDVLWIGNGNA